MVVINLWPLIGEFLNLAAILGFLCILFPSFLPLFGVEIDCFSLVVTATEAVLGLAPLNSVLPGRQELLLFDTGLSMGLESPQTENFLGLLGVLGKGRNALSSPPLKTTAFFHPPVTGLQTF